MRSSDRANRLGLRPSVSNSAYGKQILKNHKSRENIQLKQHYTSPQKNQNNYIGFGDLKQQASMHSNNSQDKR